MAFLGSVHLNHVIGIGFGEELATPVWKTPGPWRRFALYTQSKAIYFQAPTEQMAESIVLCLSRMCPYVAPLKGGRITARSLRLQRILLKVGRNPDARAKALRQAIDVTAKRRTGTGEYMPGLRDSKETEVSNPSSQGGSVHQEPRGFSEPSIFDFESTETVESAAGSSKAGASAASPSAAKAQSGQPAASMGAMSFSKSPGAKGPPLPPPSKAGSAEQKTQARFQTGGMHSSQASLTTPTGVPPPASQSAPKVRSKGKAWPLY